MSSTSDDRVIAMVPDTSTLSPESNLPCPSDSGKVEAVSVPYELLHALWCYGNLRPVVSVVYGHGTHEKCLDEADRLLALASHPTPLVGSWPGEDAVREIFQQTIRLRFRCGVNDEIETAYVTPESLNEFIPAVLKLFENTRPLIHDGAFALNGQCDHPVSEDGSDG
jgi:hypothetical protein